MPRIHRAGQWLRAGRALPRGQQAPSHQGGAAGLLPARHVMSQKKAVGFSRPLDKANRTAWATVSSECVFLSKRRVLPFEASHLGLLQAQPEPFATWNLPGCSELHGG